MSRESLPGRSSDVGPEPRQRPHPEEERFTCCICGEVFGFDSNEYRCQGAVPDLCQNSMCEECASIRHCQGCGLVACKEHLAATSKLDDSAPEDARCHCCQAVEIEEKLEALSTGECGCELVGDIRNAGMCEIHRPGGEMDNLKAALASVTADFTPARKLSEIEAINEEFPF